MHYLLLIYGDESARPEPPKTPEERAAWMAPWDTYNELLKDAGVFVGANALQDTGTASTVHATAGKTIITDGPFAETKEQLGGYYLIDTANLDDALAWAAKCPAVNTGRVEVRPVMEL